MDITEKKKEFYKRFVSNNNGQVEDYIPDANGLWSWIEKLLKEQENNVIKDLKEVYQMGFDKGGFNPLSEWREKYDEEFKLILSKFNLPTDKIERK